MQLCFYYKNNSAFFKRFEHIKIKVLHETVSKECIERQELLDKLEKTKDELLEMRKNACKYQRVFRLKCELETEFNS